MIEVQQKDQVLDYRMWGKKMGGQKDKGGSRRDGEPSLSCFSIFSPADIFPIGVLGIASAREFPVELARDFQHQVTFSAYNGTRLTRMTKPSPRRRRLHENAFLFGRSLHAAPQSA